MSEAGRFTIHLEQLEDYQFNVKFDLPKAADVLLDEPPPLGERAGPNASRMLAAAAANCLSASLLFCLAKTMDEVPAHSITAEATGRLVRDDKRKLRVGGLGIYLMKTLMDEVDYHSEPDNRNEVRMVKYFFPEKEKTNHE